MSIQENSREMFVSPVNNSVSTIVNCISDRDGMQLLKEEHHGHGSKLECGNLHLFSSLRPTLLFLFRIFFTF